MEDLTSGITSDFLVLGDVERKAFVNTQNESRSLNVLH